MQDRKKDTAELAAANSAVSFPGFSPYRMPVSYSHFMDGYPSILWMHPTADNIVLQTIFLCRNHSLADTIPLLQIHDLTHTVPARYRYGKIRGPIRAVAFVNLKPYGFIGQFLIVVLLAEMAQENLLKPVREHAV